MRYKKSYANKVLDAYITEIEAVRERIRKDFLDMDFSNASARNEMEESVAAMLMECDNLISDIELQKL